MSERINPLAGKPVPPSLLVNIPRLLTAYFTLEPDPAIVSQRVVFGTSGHRGSAFAAAFNEAHILAIAQAVCLYRHHAGIDGPLFLGMDTHALSEAAFATAIEVLAANGVETMTDEHGGRRRQPTSSIARAPSSPRTRICQQQYAKTKWRRRPAAVQPARAGRSARRSSVAQLAGIGARRARA